MIDRSKSSWDFLGCKAPRLVASWGINYTFCIPLNRCIEVVNRNYLGTIDSIKTETKHDKRVDTSRCIYAMKINCSLIMTLMSSSAASGFTVILCELMVNSIQSVSPSKFSNVSAVPDI